MKELKEGFESDVFRMMSPVTTEENVIFITFFKCRFVLGQYIKETSARCSTFAVCFGSEEKLELCDFEEGEKPTLTSMNTTRTVNEVYSDLPFYVQ